MGSRPWMKFYPRDWRGDQALRSVSMAARGLWIECICIMHEAKPYGHLLVNGEKVEHCTLARIVGISVEEVSALMAELTKAGALSIARNGAVFSRRMVRDDAAAKKGEVSARKRWEQAADNKQKNPSPNGVPNRKPNAQIPEYREETEQDKSCSGGSPPQPVLEEPNPEPAKAASPFDAAVVAFVRSNSAVKTEAQARSLIGRWRKLAADDEMLLETLREAKRQKILDLAAWIPKAIEQRRTPKPQPQLFPWRPGQPVITEQGKPDRFGRDPSHPFYGSSYAA